MYEWDFSPLIQFYPALFSGLLNTLLITVLACIFGTALAVGGLTLMLYHQRSELAVRVVAELFVALPIPVLLVWIYYCLPLVGISLDSLTSSIITMSLSLSGFLLEMLRGIARTIPTGQLEVAAASGLGRGIVAARIILPQIIRAAQPGIVANYVGTLKLSSLAALISTPELLYQANLIIATTYRPLEVYTATAVVFLIIVFPLTRLQSRLERR